MNGSTGIENVIYQGTRAYSIIGNELDNVITIAGDTNPAAGRSDTIDGGDGNDTITVGEGANSVDGGRGADSIVAGSGNDTLIGNFGNDTLDSGGGADSLVGGSGNDVFVLVGTAAQINDVQGNDTLWVSAGAASGATYDLTSIAGGAIENIVVRTAASSITGGDYTLLGNSADNTIMGGSGTDSMTGAAGNDMLVARGGADTMDGGTGNDIYVVDAAYATTGQLQILEASGTANGTADELRITQASASLADTARFGAGVANVEILRYVGTDYVGPGGGAFTGTGNDLANTIVGGNGGNSLIGGGGRDSLVGGIGADTLDGATDDAIAGFTADTLAGGSGNDWYIVNTTSDSIAGEAAGTGAGFIDTIEIRGLTSYSLGQSYNANVENLVSSGSSNVALTGSTADNTIQSGSGNDTLLGGAGNDSLSAGDGNDSLSGSVAANSAIGTDADTLAGGTGDDSYFVDSANDVVVEKAGEGTDTIRTSLATYSLAAAYAGGGTVENLRYVGDSSIGASLVGSASANAIFGGGGADTLDGGANTDTTVGDTLSGGAGNDYYILRSVNDSITGETGGTDTVQLNFDPGVALVMNARNTLPGGQILDLSGIENLVYTGASAITVTGSLGANSIISGSGNDCIYGGTGADTMAGGSGNDAYWIDLASPAGASAAGDVVREAVGGGADTIYAAALTAPVVDLASGWYDNVEALVAVVAGFATTPSNYAFTGLGNALNNTIVGGNNVNSLSGAGGTDSLVGGAVADTLDGGTGADTMSGGVGNDLYFVDDANDLVLEQAFNPSLSASSGTQDEIRVQSSAAVVSWTLENKNWGGVENLSLDPSSTAAFSASGNGWSNVITGGNQNDTLIAGQGSDTLLGGAGNDLLRTDAPKYGAGLVGFGQNNTYQQTAAYFGTGTVFDTTPGARASAKDFTISFTSSTPYTANGISDTETINVGGVTVTWNSTAGGSSTLTLTLLDGKTFTANVGRDGATHVTTITYDGTSADPTLYLDGSAVTWASTAQNAAGTATTSMSISATGSGNQGTTVLDNVRVYGVALNASEVAAITTNPQDDTTTRSDDLWALYTFPTGNLMANTAPNALFDSLSGGNASYGTISSLTSVTVINNNVLFQGHSLDGGSGNDTLVGSAGRDYLDGGTGADSMVGGADSDVYFVDSLQDRVSDSSGALDRLYVSNTVKTFSLQTSGVVTSGTIEILGVDTRPGMSSASDNFSLTGNATVTTILSGGAGADTLVGGSAADTLYGNGYGVIQNDTTVDVLMGGAGSDTYVIAFYDDGSVASGSDQINDTGPATDIDTVNINGTGVKVDLANNFNNSIENVVFSGNITAAATVLGNDANNSIIGGTGSDSLTGGGGNDTLHDGGGSGADTLAGGVADDAYVVTNANDVIIENTGEGIDTVIVNAALAAYTLQGGATSQIENLMRQYGGSAAASLYGNELDNAVSGGAGNDLLSGADGNDTLSAGTGTDTLMGGSGDDLMYVAADDYVSGLRTDRLDGGDGIDKVQFTSSTVGAKTFTMTGAQAAAMMTNIEFIEARGTNIGMTLTNVTAADIMKITGRYDGTASLTIGVDAASSTVNGTARLMDTVGASSSAGSGSTDTYTITSTVNKVNGVTTTDYTYTNNTTHQVEAHLILQAS